MFSSRLLYATVCPGLCDRVSVHGTLGTRLQLLFLTHWLQEADPLSEVMSWALAHASGVLTDKRGTSSFQRYCTTTCLHLIRQSHLAKHTRRSEHAIYSNSHRDRSTTNPLIQWLPHWDNTAVSWAVNSQTRETFWTKTLLEGLPSFPEVTWQRHIGVEVGRIWKLQESGTWLCFLKLPSSSTLKDTGGWGGTGLDSSKSWVFLIHAGN